MGKVFWVIYLWSSEATWHTAHVTSDLLIQWLLPPFSFALLAHYMESHFRASLNVFFFLQVGTIAVSWYLDFLHEAWLYPAQPQSPSLLMTFPLEFSDHPLSHFTIFVSQTKHWGQPRIKGRKIRNFPSMGRVSKNCDQPDTTSGSH
jgi:hypothetical protein